MGIGGGGVGVGGGGVGIGGGGVGLGGGGVGNGGGGVGLGGGGVGIGGGGVGVGVVCPPTTIVAFLSSSILIESLINVEDPSTLYGVIIRQLKRKKN